MEVRRDFEAKTTYSWYNLFGTVFAVLLTILDILNIKYSVLI
jgi:hypothetical protein